MTNNPEFRDQLENDPLAALRNMGRRQDSGGDDPARRAIVDPNKLTLDPAVQPREEIDEATVEAYAQDMQGGAVFPPVVIFHDGERYYLADGWHRVLAARAVHAPGIQAEVHNGTLRDAILYSAGVNKQHGLRRTNADKRRAALVLLRDGEWAKWSDRQIARHVGVSPDTVGRLRGSLSESVSERTYVDKHGNVSTMDTSNIGLLTDEDRRARAMVRAVERIVSITRIKLPEAPSRQERSAIQEAIQEARRYLDDLESQL